MMENPWPNRAHILRAWSLRLGKPLNLPRTLTNNVNSQVDILPSPYLLEASHIDTPPPPPGDPIYVESTPLLPLVVIDTSYCKRSDNMEQMKMATVRDSIDLSEAADNLDGIISSPLQPARQPWMWNWFSPPLLRQLRLELPQAPQ
jgi:hypothetical protein